MKATMGKHRTAFHILFVLTLSLAIAACGGGGGGSSTVPGGTGGVGTGTGMVTLQGSVPGTVFVAVDDDTNLEAGSAIATGTGTTKNFTMDLPTGATYRFYVMENDGTSNSRVYPMYMGANNVFALDNTADGQTISLGMIQPDMATGRATPANDPALMMGRGASGSVPPSLGGMAFSMDNVMGTTWGYNTMMTSGTMGWEHGTLAFDNNGMGHMTGIVRNGTPLPDRNDIPYTMSLSGMLLNPGDSTFQCVVSRDRSVMVATFTDGTGGPAMMIGQRRGGTFQSDGSDMTGTWRFQRFTAGNDNTTSGWGYGTMGNASGIASITSITTNNGPGTIRNFAFIMDGNGIMTDGSDASFHGVMSMDKSMIVATDTDNGGHPELWVMMRATTASTADLVGDWVMHSVSSGNAGSRDWTFGHSVVDASGKDTFSGMMGSGGSFSTTPMTFQMSGGVMTMGGTGGGTGGGMMGGDGGMMGGGMMTSTFHGITNGARTIMVSTYSDGNGGYPFSIQVK